MYFVAQDGKVYDDGRGGVTAPAYGVSPYGERYELRAEDARHLTEQFFRDHGRGLGDMVAAATSAVGFQPCVPCKRRQEWLNDFGARIGRIFHESRESTTR